MTHPRPSAWALICVLVAGLLGSAGTTVTLAADPPKCTGWTDEFHPPTEIRVRRRNGPNAGTVETVPFWDYVGTVLRAEYSSGSTKSWLWMRIGALTVKEYAWYYTMKWRGGKLTITNEDGTTTTQCYDVTDGTGDQIYKPQKLINGVWVPANEPSAANLQAMADTWSMSLRKWNPNKLFERLFLTGYRSGKKRPCGADSTGFKILQKSLRDCGTKGMTFEETLRRYYEPNVHIVDPREHHILDDVVNGQPTYFGDLGLLNQGAGDRTEWRLYAGLDDGFVSPVTGSFDVNPSKIVGQGLGDATGDGRNDLVMLLAGNIRLAMATGTGYADPTSQDLPAGAPSDELLVSDFDGDLLADVGLLRSTPIAPLPEEPATLVVMKANADGTFSAPVDWWRGVLSLDPNDANKVAAGDVNGDGKADLVIRDATAGTTFWVAPSFASCADFTTVGVCTLVPGSGLDAAAVWLDKPGWNAAEVKWTLTDYNRDGRSDIVAIVKDGGAIDALGATALVGGGFSDTRMMWQAGTHTLAEVVPLGMDINPDGLGDLVLLKKGGGNTTLQWLRASQAAGSQAVTFVPTTGYNDASLPWAPGITKAY